MCSLIKPTETHTQIRRLHATVFIITLTHRWRVVTCWDSDSAWARTVMGGRSWESGLLLRELMRSLSFCTAKVNRQLILVVYLVGLHVCLCLCLTGRETEKKRKTEREAATLCYSKSKMYSVPPIYKQGNAQKIQVIFQSLSWVCLLSILLFSPTILP